MAQAHRKIRPQTPGCKLGRACHSDKCARPKASICLGSTYQTIANTCLEINKLWTNLVNDTTYLKLLPSTIVPNSSNTETYSPSACAVLSCNMALKNNARIELDSEVRKMWTATR